MSHRVSLHVLLCLCALCLLLAGAAGAQEAVTAHRRTVDELVDESAYIIHGHVSDVRLEPHPELRNLPTIVVTMKVDEVLKGDVPKTFTFRQFVWDVRKAQNSGYKKKQELLLFLRPPSRYGLTSPAGLEQGRFVIQSNASGNATAENADNNVGLFTALSKAAQRRGAVLPATAETLHGGGPVSLRDLKAVIRSFTVRSR